MAASPCAVDRMRTASRPYQTTLPNTEAWRYNTQQQGPFPSVRAPRILPFSTQHQVNVQSERAPSRSLSIPTYLCLFEHSIGSLLEDLRRKTVSMEFSGTAWRLQLQLPPSTSPLCCPQTSSNLCTKQRCLVSSTSSQLGLDARDWSGMVARNILGASTVIPASAGLPTHPDVHSLPFAAGSRR